MFTKKFVFYILAGSMLLTSSNVIYASSQASAGTVTITTMQTSKKTVQKPQVIKNMQIFLNGEKATINDPIVSVSGTTLLPIRSVGELLNCTVDFDSKNKVAIVRLEDTTLEIPLGYSFIVNNRQVIQIPVASLTYNSKIYLPVRAISENLPNVDIKYYSDIHTISITTEGAESINASTSAPIVVDREGWVFMGTKEMHELLKKKGFDGTGSDITYSIKHKEYAHYEKVLIAIDLQKDQLRLYNIKEMIPNIDFTSGIKRYQTENQEYVVIIGEDKEDLEKQVKSYQL